MRSLRKIISGSEEYSSRPCMNIDVCSERQVTLVLKVDGSNKVSFGSRGFFFSPL